MALIRQYHKDTDTTYVYESISYWDEEKKQSRSKRRVIGKLDPGRSSPPESGAASQRRQRAHLRIYLPSSRSCTRTVRTGSGSLPS